MNAPGRPLAFPSTARLRKRIEFEQVRREGSDKTGRMMRLAVFRTGTKEATRIGIITSRRLGSAVTRSRLRRRFREICRINRQGLSEGVWMVVIPRAAAAKANHEELLEEWLKLTRQLNILRSAK
ncbi:MAG: ribonuclease P protein component [Chthoniobacterales bacterium]